MEKIKRSLFFWLLAILFFAAGPAVILYSQGFRFDFRRGVFVHSGTITFKANPQNFSVKINGKPNDSKQLNRINSSFNVQGLLPGEYEVGLEKEGFQSWKKKTSVHSGVASEFWNILLVRNNYEKTSYNAQADKFYTSPSNDYIAYEKKSESGLAVGLFNISSEQTEYSYDFPEWNFIEDSRNENIEWSPEQDYLSIPVEKKLNNDLKKYNYFIINVGENSAFNLNEFLNIEDARVARWDPKEKNYLFFLSGTSLYRASVKDSSDVKKISDDVSSFSLSRTNLYFVKNPNNLIYKSPTDGSSDPQQITGSFPDKNNPEIYRLITYDDSRIALLGKNKNLYIFNKGDREDYFKKIGEEVEGVHFSDDGKKMLFWDKNEISAYFTEDWEVQPFRSENELTNITRYSDELKNVQWFKDYEHVIFSTGKYVKIIELDPRDHRNCMDLLTAESENPFVIYNNYQEKLYFVDSKNGSNQIYSIDFPEPAPILGIGE